LQTIFSPVGPQSICGHFLDPELEAARDIRATPSAVVVRKEW
jgi:hypothetical protein